RPFVGGPVGSLHIGRGDRREVLMKSLLGIALTLLILAGCKVAATADDYRWTIKAPAQVSLAPHSKLHFVVEARSHGQLVAEVPYMWVVEWVGVHGVRHQGWSLREEDIL